MGYSGHLIEANKTYNQIAAEPDIGRYTFRRSADYAPIATSRRSRRRTCWASRRETARRWLGAKELVPQWHQLNPPGVRETLSPQSAA
jgi:hypothetical protein